MHHRQPQVSTIQNNYSIRSNTKIGTNQSIINEINKDNNVKALKITSLIDIDLKFVNRVFKDFKCLNALVLVGAEVFKHENLSYLTNFIKFHLTASTLILDFRGVNPKNLKSFIINQILDASFQNVGIHRLKIGFIDQYNLNYIASRYLNNESNNINCIEFFCIFERSNFELWNLALKHNVLLKSLAISHSSLSSANVESMAKSLLNNTKLQELKINGNIEVGPEGVSSIAKMLKINHTLKVLDISYCNGGARGFRDLIEAIRGNFTVTRLAFNDIINILNNTELVNILWFLKSISDKNTLVSLDFNGLIINCRDEIIQLFSNNKSLIKINIGGDVFTEITERNWKTLIDNIRKIVKFRDSMLLDLSNKELDTIEEQLKLILDADSIISVDARNEYLKIQNELLDYRHACTLSSIARPNTNFQNLINAERIESKKSSIYNLLNY